MALALSDDELRIIQDCARPLAPGIASPSSRRMPASSANIASSVPALSVASCRELQHQHFRPPSFHLSKYDRGDFVR
jgi:hypothetical protein